MLFAPPFDQAPVDPGYIKGYPPGVRENGGQYTHAALWSVIAFTMLGEGDKAAGLLSMLNPINHSRNRPEAHRYKLEPYVVAADIYSQPPHVGRGGWSWYTGAAGWMYRAGVEHVLGLRIEGAFLHLDPCIPKHWRSYEMTLKRDSSRLRDRRRESECRQTGIAHAEYDGFVLSERPLRLPLEDDGRVHRVKVILGTSLKQLARHRSDSKVAFKTQKSVGIDDRENKLNVRNGSKADIQAACRTLPRKDGAVRLAFTCPAMPARRASQS